MELLQPRKGTILQFVRELNHCRQFLVRDRSGNLIDRLVSLVVESLESLNKPCIGLYCEFERLDCLDVMTCLSGRPMTRSPERGGCATESCIKSSDKPKIGRDGFDS